MVERGEGENEFHPLNYLILKHSSKRERDHMLCREAERDSEMN